MASSTPAREDSELRVVVLGGLAEAVLRVLRGLPVRPGYAVIVAGPPPRELADELRGFTSTVVQVTQDVQVLRNHVYLLPQAREVTFRREQLLVSPAAATRAPLDTVLRSVADELGREAVGVILAGHGADGTIGIKRMKEAGGLTIAQADAVAEGASMPRSAIASGLIDIVVGLDAIAEKLRLALEDPAEPPGGLDPTERLAGESVADTLRDILTLVRIRSGHDFAAYKRATLFRRVSRRMQVCGVGSISDYHRYLREHPAELAHLMRDFLISVTNFFRDRDAFRALTTTVIPSILAEKKDTDAVRVWVAGCATGEEAYSLAMLLVEAASAHHEALRIQVFATDIDEDALSEARTARYPATIDVDVSPERLERFFVQESGGYRVGKELRELVLFSPHNVLRDPPFSRLDLVSCRNLLIYLNREAQDRALNVFHFGLRPGGALFLGSSESAENSPMFEAIDAKHRLFLRRPHTTTIGGDSMITGARWQPPEPLANPARPPERPASVGELHQRVVERLAPPSVLVSADLDVLHLSEHAARYFEVAGGEPTRQLLRLVIAPLRIDLRACIYAARQPGVGHDARVVRFHEAAGDRAVEVRVYAATISDVGSGSLLVTFAEVAPSAQPSTGLSASESAASIEPVVREMEDELHRTRDQLRTTIEQYETSLEELKASNEELQAINEELRSATEELETGREELQSVNEELTTLNQELKSKVEEVSRANSDLQNLMTSTEIGVVFLDREMRIQRFTPRAQDIFNVIPSDIGRPLNHLTHRLDVEDLPELAQDVLQSLRVREREAATTDGKRYLVRLLPYRSMADRIEGVVVTFVDVSAQRDATDAQSRSEAALARSEERLRMALRVAPLVLLSLDRASDLSWGYAQTQELRPGRLAAMTLFGEGQADRLARVAHAVLASGTAQRLELLLRIDGTPRSYDFRIEPSQAGVIAIGLDLTAAPATGK